MPLTGFRSVLRNTAAGARVFDAMIRSRRFDGVMVLCYHAVRPDAQPDGSMPFEGLHVRCGLFESHCALVARLCHPISLTAWRQALSGDRALPPRPVLITFDDGYRSVATDALPILEKFEMPATVFVCSDPVERRQMFWHDAVAHSQGEQAVAELKSKPYRQWLEATERARRSVGDTDPAAPLTAREIETLAAHPLIEIGGHTHRHPILATASENEQQFEIAENLRLLTAWARKPIRAFAYPNGRAGIDYTTRSEELVGNAGIDQSFGADEGIAARRGSPLSQPRFMVTTGITEAQLLYRLAWLWK